MNNILILTGYTKEIEWGGYGKDDFSHIAAECNKKYAGIRKYNFIYEVLDQKYKDFYPSWIKIPLILKHLPDYDYVCWVDGDAIFTNSQGLEEFLDKNICLTQAIPARGVDTQYTYTSTGFMIFKNSEFSFKVLETLLEQAEVIEGGAFKYSNFHEQGLLDELFIKKEIEECFGEGKEILLGKIPELLSEPFLTENFRILPHNYQECSDDVDPIFIYHACGDLSTRRKRLLNYSKKLRMEQIKQPLDWGENSDIGFVNNVSKEIFADDCYERIFPVREGDIVVDLGASIGPFTWKVMDRASKVYAFEPMLEPLSTLRNNTEGFPVTIINKALNHVTGECRFPFWDMSTGGPCETNMPIDRTIEIKEKGLTIECTTFMDFVKEYNIDKIDFIKTDCEGGEYKLFKDENIEFLLNNVRNICGEFHLFNDGWGKREFRYIRDKYFKLFKKVEARSLDNVDITWDLYNDHFIDYYSLVYLYFSNE